MTLVEWNNWIICRLRWSIDIGGQGTEHVYPMSMWWSGVVWMKSTQTTRDFESRLRWWLQISKTRYTILEPNNVCLATKESIPVRCVPPLLYGGDTLLSGRNTGPETPYPPKEHGTRDTLPPKEHGTRDTLLPRRNMRPEVPHPPRRNMGPKIPYPLPYPPPGGQNDIFLWKHYLPTTSFAGGNNGPNLCFFPKMFTLSELNNGSLGSLRISRLETKIFQ